MLNAICGLTWHAERLTDKSISLTVKGIIVLLVAGLLKGLEVPGADGRALELVETVALVVGALIAFYGRYRHGDIDIFGFKK